MWRVVRRGRKREGMCINNYTYTNTYIQINCAGMCVSKHTTSATTATTTATTTTATDHLHTTSLSTKTTKKTKKPFFLSRKESPKPRPNQDYAVGYGGGAEYGADYNPYGPPPRFGQMGMMRRG